MTDGGGFRCRDATPALDSRFRGLKPTATVFDRYAVGARQESSWDHVSARLGRLFLPAVRTGLKFKSEGKLLLRPKRFTAIYTLQTPVGKVCQNEPEEHKQKSASAPDSIREVRKNDREEASCDHSKVRIFNSAKHGWLEWALVSHGLCGLSLPAATILQPWRTAPKRLPPPTAKTR